MQTKKIIGIALAAALVGSMATIAVSARDFVPDDEMANYTKNHTFGIVGSITGWGEQPDIAMTDADEDGILVGVVRDIPAGDYEFKVRADSAWGDSWGDYEPDYERTMNSQTNFKISVKSSSDLIVALEEETCLACSNHAEIVVAVAACDSFITDRVQRLYCRILCIFNTHFVIRNLAVVGNYESVAEDCRPAKLLHKGSCKLCKRIADDDNLAH